MNDRSQDVSMQIANLETAVAHQQHAYDGLNQVVVEQAKAIELLQRKLAKLESTIGELRSQLPGEERDLVDEKPPHY